jgi:hypothetical protein
MRRAGDMYEVGAGRGRFYSLNVPLKDGIDDEGEGREGGKGCSVGHHNTVRRGLLNGARHRLPVHV